MQSTHKTKNLKFLECIQLIKRRSVKFQRILFSKNIKSNFNLGTLKSLFLHKYILFPPCFLMSDPNLTTVQGIVNRKWTVSLEQKVKDRIQNCEEKSGGILLPDHVIVLLNRAWVVLKFLHLFFQRVSLHYPVVTNLNLKPEKSTRLSNS